MNMKYTNKLIDVVIPILIVLVLLVSLTVSWKTPKCYHIFVEEQELFITNNSTSSEEFSRKAFLIPFKVHDMKEINVEGRTISLDKVTSGKRIVCIKCLWQTRQLVDINPVDSNSAINLSTLYLIAPKSSKDTIKWKVLTIRGDTLK